MGLTSVLVASCIVLAALFAVMAALMHYQGYQRAARANLVAGLCCLLGALIVPSGSQALPVATLAVASMLGVSSLRAVRAGRG